MDGAPQVNHQATMAHTVGTMQERRACMISGVVFLMIGIFGIIPSAIGTSLGDPAVAALLMCISAIVAGITGLIIASRATLSVIQMTTATAPPAPPVHQANPQQLPGIIKFYLGLVTTTLILAIGSIIQGIIQFSIRSHSLYQYSFMTASTSIGLGVFFLFTVTIQLYILKAALINIHQFNSVYGVPVLSGAPIVVGGYHPNNAGFTHNQFAAAQQPNQTTAYQMPYPYPSSTQAVTNFGNQNYPPQGPQNPAGPPSYSDAVKSGISTADLRTNKY